MWKWLPVVSTGLPSTKERYCSMVSLGGVDTRKSNIQMERREEKRKKRFFTIKLTVKRWRVKMEGLMN